MGLQCSIVLRREESSQPCWKIGLVPADRVKNKRIISYFVAQEPTIGNAAARYIPTEQDDEINAYFEPPSEGWFTVSQEENGSMLGRATALTIEYED